MQGDTIKCYFQKDHERLDNLLEEFQAASSFDIESGREFFEKFKRGLEQHMAWEEEILFPFFESKTGMRGGGPTYVMRYEHDQLKTLLKDIQEKINKEETGEEQVNMLTTLLAQHNHKEENMLYPMIDESISSEERQEVFQKITGSPHTGSGGCGCGVEGH